MSKPSTKVVQGLRRLHYRINHNHHRPPNPSFSSPSSTAPNPPSAIGFSNSTTMTSHSRLLLKLLSRSFATKPTYPSFSNGAPPIRNSSSKIYSYAKQTPQPFSSRILVFPKTGQNYFGFRSFSLKSSEFGKLNRNFAKTVFDKPMTLVGSAFSRYGEAIGLQIEAFFKRNYLFLLGVGGFGVCILLWRIMFSIANTFVVLSEGMAKYGFFALSSAIVAFAGLYIRSWFSINPDKVYRMAMRTLNTSAGILEVMGAPLSGTDLRAYVMSGGGLTLKKFKPILRSKRCFLIFPIRGSERKGLVSVEVKKKKGQYDMKLLAVDIPMASGPDQRLFLVGDEKEYQIGGGFISQLRDPVVKAMAATKEFDSLDKIEEEEDAQRELEEAEKKHQKEIEKLETGGP